jgi:hypothetical protein
MAAVETVASEGYIFKLTVLREKGWSEIKGRKL